MNRRILALLVALVPVVASAPLMAVVTVPYVSLGPGPTFNTLGEVDGKQVVEIKGTQLRAASGQLAMTTVSQRDGLPLGLALGMWMSGREQLLPRDLVYPPDKSKEDVDKDNSSDFELSEDSAEHAALGYLRYPQALTVEAVNDPGPAAGKLVAGDAVDAINGTRITSLDQFQSLLKDSRPGQQVIIDFRRKNAAPGAVTITLGANPDRDYGYLGAALRQAPWAPFTIDFNLADIGGPSAGLMFSLAVVDKLTDGDLAGPRFVAGTGTITPDGQVGPIGGILHKMRAAREAGATVFLVPAGNCDEARSGSDDGLQLVKVQTLGQAVDALRTISAGGTAARC